jgi:hypothetical protein
VFRKLRIAHLAQSVADRGEIQLAVRGLHHTFPFSPKMPGRTLTISDRMISATIQVGMTGSGTCAMVGVR